MWLYEPMFTAISEICCGCRVNANLYVLLCISIGLPVYRVFLSWVKCSPHFFLVVSLFLSFHVFSFHFMYPPVNISKLYNIAMTITLFHRQIK